MSRKLSKMSGRLSQPLPDEVKEVMRKVCDAMRGVCSFCGFDFGDLGETYEWAVGESGAYPCRLPIKQVTPHEPNELCGRLFRIADSQDMVALLCAFMSPRELGHLFCYMQHCSVGYNALKDEFEEGIIEQEEETTEHSSPKQLFAAEPFLLQYTRAPGNYYEDRLVERASYSSVYEQAPLFWRTGLLGSDMFRQAQLGGLVKFTATILVDEPDENISRLL